MSTVIKNPTDWPAPVVAELNQIIVDLKARAPQEDGIHLAVEALSNAVTYLTSGAPARASDKPIAAPPFKPAPPVKPTQHR